ncbi:MAG: GerMN domain-containing protein [Eubacteriales bacterium]|nr:GerMN domain-containing protein [Eubacteriales bacterium]
MKKLLLVLLPIVLMLSSCGSAGDGNVTTRKSETTESQATPRVSDYFPLNSDVYMMFKGTGNEYAEYETYIEYVKGNVVQKRVINPGTVSVVVYTVDDNELRKVFSRGETYYRNDFTDQSENGEILIKAPIKVGTSWTLADGSTRTITCLNKKLSVVAGDFEAIEITTVSKDSTIVDYYVKNTGLIKTEFKAAGDEPFTVVSELERLSASTPLKEHVKIFYPEYEKTRLIYTVNEIELFTNENAYTKLCTLLKTAPEVHGLSNVLSPNVKINFVKLDEENKICYVDFTEELISEMSAGSAMESMILQCIANTFGEYYQKDKVIITVGGKTYEGGHIAFMEGEYLSVTKDESPELKID